MKRFVFAVGSAGGKPLEATNKDAASFHSLLLSNQFGGGDQGSPMALMGCKSIDDFNKELNSLLRHWDKENQLIFYFSGHGTLTKNKYCLVLGDTSVDLLPFDSFTERLELGGVEKAIIVLDACAAGQAAKGATDCNDQSLIPELDETDLPDGMAVLASSGPAQLSWQNAKGDASVFTEVLLTVLREGIDNQEEFIFVDDAVQSVSDIIKSEARYADYQQSPVFSVRGSSSKIWLARNVAYSKNVVIDAEIKPDVYSATDLELLAIEKLQEEHPSKLESINELDWDLVSDYRDVADGLNTESNTSTTAADLQRLGLISPITVKDRPVLHRSAALCFCIRPDRFHPESISIYLDTSNEAFDRREIRGSFAKQLIAIQDLVTAKLTINSFIDSSGERQEQAEINLEIFREVVANAFVHRDFSVSGNVEVRLADNWVEISNPGSLLVGGSFHEILESTFRSVPRNPVLMLLMNRLRRTEQIGRGFKLIREYVKANGEDAIQCYESNGPITVFRLQRRRQTVKRKAKEPINTGFQGSKVFISYSHDSQSHRDFVRRISDQLCIDGVDCLIDQYINGSPPEGWQRWMENAVEAADFVLIACTENYFRRFHGRETGGGKGVTFEGVVISQIIYDSYNHNTKFVPILPKDGDFEYVPLQLKSYTPYTLPEQYDDIYRYLTEQPKYVRPEIGSQKVMPLESNNPSNSEALSSDKIQINKLPHTNSYLFGRETELTMLDNAWADGVNVLILKAMGGTGKTSLLKNWLGQFGADGYRGAQAVFTWSFYSQGSAENKQISTDNFFAEALRFFGYTELELPAPHDRGMQLAKLVTAQRTLLILDGLEPLQHPVGTLRGELKDQGLKALLQQLATSNSGLCLISSRQTVEELKGKASALVLEHDLEHLQVKDGVELLQHIGVSGFKTELEMAVREVTGHALALNLLGNYIKTVLKGDIRQRDKISGLMAERHDGQHAQKMLAAYENHLKGTTALSVLYLMGLFDRPVSPGAIQCLQQAKITGLTNALGSEADWHYAIADLREQKLLNAINPDYPENLDCHPLIREYFAQQLKSQYPETWQQAHACLYAYYKDMPEKELPDTLEEMQPLFSAMSHGCAAGLHQQAFDEVYWPRTQRDSENYLCNKLGAFSDDLAAIAHFFATPWQTPAEDLTDATKAVLLNLTGFRLRALGRLREAVELMQAAIANVVDQEDWQNAASGASSLSELHLTLGDTTKAVSSAVQSVAYADKSRYLFWSMGSRAAHADALHQTGEFARAGELFQTAEALQQEHQPAYARLYSLQGFQYCDLLLAQGGDEGIKGVVERAEYALELSEKYVGRGLGLHDVALGKLILGQAHLQLALSTPSYSLDEAKEWLEQAVVGLRVAGSQHHLPRGLLARAALFRHSNDFDRTRQDLWEVHEISSLSGMRLHLTDYHLEMARLLLTEERIAGIPNHIQEANRLINETGYHRRDQELLELQQALTEHTN